MKEKNNEIEQTLSSLDGIERAKAPDDMYQRVMDEIAKNRQKVAKIIPMTYVLRAAAVFGGIVLFNAASLFLTKNLKLEDSNGQYTEGGNNAQPNATYVLANAFFKNQSIHF